MTNDRFDDLVAPYRRELQAHCYRMLGSLADAEDQVQETLLRAWRGIDGFEGRSSVRAWLYKIATNTCIDALRGRLARIMPVDGGSPGDPSAPLAPAPDELPWVDPCPPGLWDATTATPEARYSARESVQLAFIVALQHLPATQRAVLILREIAGWSAAEVAELLDATVASVNSALQRARATLETRRAWPATPALAPDLRPLLARYVAAWERSDLDALVALLHDDVVTSMPPYPVWFRGREAFATFMASRLGPPGCLRVVPVASPDDAAFAFYRRADAHSPYQAHSIKVIRIADGLVSELHVFLTPALFPRFGLPPVLPGDPHDDR
jgi:RNA polymerase sigma-70 factor (ECF subfamily)